MLTFASEEPMNTDQIIPPFNNTGAVGTAGTAVFSPNTGDVFSKNTNRRNVNNAGMLAVTQVEGGDTNAECELWGSIDGVNFSPLVKNIAFTGASGGLAKVLFYPVALPPYIRLLLVRRASSVNNTTSGVAVTAVY